MSDEPRDPSDKADPAEAAVGPDWLIVAYFGTAETTLPELVDEGDEDPDDELLDETPAYIVAMLGFDPREIEQDDAAADEDEPRGARP